MMWLVVMVAAAVCFWAGAWQWQRLHDKHAANVELRTNNDDAIAPVAQVLRPVGDPGAVDAAKAAEYRPVTATGSYLPGSQSMVRDQGLDGAVGFYVLTPMRLDSGETLLVVRGWIRAGSDARSTPSAPPSPAGPVTITARAMPAQSGSEKYGQLPAGQIAAINPAEAAARLGAPVLAGYVTLEDGQPGAAGLTAVPAPDMSNPAGGAIEPQHLAYVIQWFVFGLLALALPLILARADLRQSAARAALEPGQARVGAARDATAGTSARNEAAPARAPQETISREARVSAKLADRYGR